MLSADQQTDPWTRASLGRRHHEVLPWLFVQSVRLTQEAGLVMLGHGAVPDTRLKVSPPERGDELRADERKQQHLTEAIRCS